MYVTRSYHIWKEVQLLPWLERNVQIVLDRVDAKDPMVKNMENLRATLYSAKPPLNIHRHLLLSDMSDTIAPPAEVISLKLISFYARRGIRTYWATDQNRFAARRSLLIG